MKIKRRDVLTSTGREKYSRKDKRVGKNTEHDETRCSGYPKRQEISDVNEGWVVIETYVVRRPSEIIYSAALLP